MSKSPSPSTLNTILLAATALLTVSLLNGCGYKGPLYLPPPPDTLETDAPTVSTDTLGQQPITTGFESERVEHVPIKIE
ncbi:LPS translocon maturation chaperone LptM [Orrella sp. 11846]|uniref:LPS translocon maturation chaperone LptM n=1 Tax=Orrella sp. 11846 TaxID=3409913 RepID=UPI003B58B9A5